MAELTERFGLSYFGGPVPGSLTQDGAKFTLFDPQVVDRVLAALEDHAHTGGVRVEDPGTQADDAPDATLATTGGALPAGRTFYYSFSYLDRYGLETARSAEAEIVTEAPIETPLPPSLTKRDPQTAVRSGQLLARVAAVGTVVTFSGLKTIDGIEVAAGDRVLLTGQPDKVTNGLWIVATGAWTRATDTIREGTSVWITAGDKRKKRTYIQTQEIDTVGEDAQVWAHAAGLANEVYSYALTALKGTQETPLSYAAQVSPDAGGGVVLALPDLPAGAEELRIWRKGYADAGWTKIGTSAEATFFDDGHVPKDECACEPANMPPAVNTTNGRGRVHVVLGLEQQHDLEDEDMGILAWRLYRTEISDAYSARSLVAQIPVRDKTTMEYLPTRRNDENTADLNVWEIYDDGDPLLVGSPLERSTTLTPTQPIPLPTGPLPTVLSDLPLHMLWLNSDTWQLYALTNDNDIRSWTPITSAVAPGSIRDEHIAADAAIAMSKLALDPVLDRVTALETVDSAGRLDAVELAAGDLGERLGTLEMGATATTTALDDMLARLDALEQAAGRDATALHYRGTYDPAQTYLGNDLAVHEGALYLTTAGQAASSDFDPAAWEAFPPS